MRTPVAAGQPVVVIAHGFAGSQGLMAPFAATLARAGMVAVTFDSLGHGAHPEPLTGDVARAEGATANLLSQLDSVTAFARGLPGSDGRVALLGHSMASDIVVRHAIAHPEVEATVAVSLFSREVTADQPRNLLVITGAWEGPLATEALRVAGLAQGQPAASGETVTNPATGDTRRAILSPGVEHVGVLYSPTSQREARDWLAGVFGLPPGEAATDDRARWLGLWTLAATVLGWALAPLLPRVSPPRQRGSPRRAGFAAATLLPALFTPLLATLTPRGLLPAPVADYLGLHILIYGLLTGATLRALRWSGPGGAAAGPLVLATLAFSAFGALAIHLPVDAFITELGPERARLGLLAALTACLIPWFLAEETLTRAPEAPRGAGFLSKLAFLASLGLAIALDPGRLFFLILILPVMLVFFALFGTFARWSARASGSPLPAAIGSALLFGWAISATFPILGI